MINFSSNARLRALFLRKRNLLKGSMRRRIAPLAGLAATTLTPEEQWKRFSEVPPVKLDERLKYAIRVLGPRRGSLSFDNYLDTMVEMGKGRGEEDHRFALARRRSWPRTPQEGEDTPQEGEEMTDDL